MMLNCFKNNYRYLHADSVTFIIFNFEPPNKGLRIWLRGKRTDQAKLSGSSHTIPVYGMRFIFRFLSITHCR